MPHRLSTTKYSNVLSNIEIIKIGFLEICSHFEVENLKEGAISVDANNEVEFKLPDASRTLAAVDNYTFVGKLEDTTLFKITLKIMVVFECKIKPDKDFLNIFERNTLKVITYPYVREEVQNLTTKMGITPLILPMWRVPKQANKKYLRAVTKKDTTGKDINN